MWLSICSEEIKELDDIELDRFEFFSRSHFNKKRILNTIMERIGINKDDRVNNYNTNNNILPTTVKLPSDQEFDLIAITVASMTKMFVGDITMLALHLLNNEHISTHLNHDNNVSMNSNSNNISPISTTVHTKKTSIQPFHIK
jgi:hypothetical protein